MTVADRLQREDLGGKIEGRQTGEKIRARWCFIESAPITSGRITSGI